MPLDRQLNSLCARCGGTGLVRVHSHEDYGVSFESEICETCDYGQTLLHVEVLHEEMRDMKDELRKFAEWLERDRREPDKVLCVVQSMRRAAL